MIDQADWPFGTVRMRVVGSPNCKKGETRAIDESVEVRA